MWEKSWKQEERENRKTDELQKIFPERLKGFLKAGFELQEKPEEIRLRIGAPLLLDTGRDEWFWDEKRKQLTKDTQKAYPVSKEDIKELVTRMGNYSLYAFEEELRAGFLTIPGGHRVGLAGKVVCENGNVKTIRQISFLNIRIAAEQKGCGTKALPYLRKGNSIYNTLIFSPPGAGKTTLLRDIVRQLSEGTREYPGLKVGVVDERSELAACYLGIPQNDLGPRTDVMDACPKSEGMLMLLRSMSPQVLGVDELGGQADYEAVEYALHCGCRLIGTMHGESVEEMERKPYLAKWLEQGFFERYLFLQKKADKGREIRILNERLEQIC